MLFVVGGSDPATAERYLRSAEVVNLNGTCSAQIADYPIIVEKPTVAFIDGQV